MDGADLPEEAAELAALAAERTVFARLTPEHKRALVEALDGAGAYVAMIGDGVNDVPAMKGARLAVALGSGSQLAKSVADSVLVTDRFGAIPDAVGEGRRIIGNVQRVAQAVRDQVGVRGLRDRDLRAVDGRVPAAAAPPVAGGHVHRRACPASCWR